MHRRVKIIGVVILASVLLEPSAVRATTMAVDLVSGGSPAPFAQPPRAAGWRFALSGNHTVTALGFWDEGGDGLAASHQVGLWTDAGALLGTAVVDNSGTLVASTHTSGHWVFVTLGTPIALGTGTYRIAGVMSVDFQRHQIANALPPLIESFAPGVTWLNAAFGPGFGGFVFPGSLQPQESQDGFYGPNLMLTVPEPTTAVLLACGLVGLGVRRRLH